MSCVNNTCVCPPAHYYDFTTGQCVAFGKNLIFTVAIATGTRSKIFKEIVLNNECFLTLHEKCI